MYIYTYPNKLNNKYLLRSAVVSGPLLTIVLFFGWIVLPAGKTDSWDWCFEGLSTPNSKVTCLPALPGGRRDVVGIDPGGLPPSMVRTFGLTGRPFLRGVGGACLLSSSGLVSSSTRSMEEGRTVIFKGDLHGKIK
jgi:hypothetical protein